MDSVCPTHLKGQDNVKAGEWEKRLRLDVLLSRNTLFNFLQLQLVICPHKRRSGEVLS
jgi:hypothetical protein